MPRERDEYDAVVEDEMAQLAAMGLCERVIVNGEVSYQITEKGRFVVESGLLDRAAAGRVGGDAGALEGEEPA